MSKIHNIIVFGSLRRYSKRGYNFNRFGGQNFIQFVTLNGFEMYSLGEYPTVCEGNGIIKAELHTVEDGPFHNIRRMEIYAGYQEKTVNVDGIEATIFVWKKGKIKQYRLPRVETGNWD